MHDISIFFAMGGYAAYVWPAYALTAVTFAALLTWTIGTLRARRRLEHDLAVLGKAHRVRQERPT